MKTATASKIALLATGIAAHHPSLGTPGPATVATTICILTALGIHGAADRYPIGTERSAAAAAAIAIGTAAAIIYTGAAWSLGLWVQALLGFFGILTAMNGLHKPRQEERKLAALHQAALKNMEAGKQGMERSNDGFARGYHASASELEATISRIREDSRP